MPVAKTYPFTARDEVAMEDRYNAVFSAAGWRLVATHGFQRTIAFCSRNKVQLLQYQGLFKGVTNTCFIDIPQAHCTYEKRFVNALEKQNQKNMELYGLTMDPEVNSVLRMCL